MPQKCENKQGVVMDLSEKYNISSRMFMKMEEDELHKQMGDCTAEALENNVYQLTAPNGHITYKIAIVDDYIFGFTGSEVSVYRFPEIPKLNIQMFSSINKDHMLLEKRISVSSLPNQTSGWDGDVAMHELYVTLLELEKNDLWLPRIDEIVSVMKAMNGYNHDQYSWEYEIGYLFSEFHKELWDALDKDNEIFGCTYTRVDLKPLVAMEILNKKLSEVKPCK